jgi:hypothetical protein
MILFSFLELLAHGLQGLPFIYGILKLDVATFWYCMATLADARKAGLRLTNYQIEEYIRMDTQRRNGFYLQRSPLRPQDWTVSHIHHTHSHSHNPPPEVALADNYTLSCFANVSLSLSMSITYSIDSLAYWNPFSCLRQTKNDWTPVSSRRFLHNLLFNRGITHAY